MDIVVCLEMEREMEMNVRRDKLKINLDIDGRHRYLYLDLGGTLGYTYKLSEIKTTGRDVIFSVCLKHPFNSIIDIDVFLNLSTGTIRTKVSFGSKCLAYESVIGHDNIKASIDSVGVILYVLETIINKNLKQVIDNRDATLHINNYNPGLKEENYWCSAAK